MVKLSFFTYLSNSLYGKSVHERNIMFHACTLMTQILSFGVESAVLLNVPHERAEAEHLCIFINLLECL